MPKHIAETYAYRVTWSEEDKKHIGRCDEFPSLRSVGDSGVEALNRILDLVIDAHTPGGRPTHAARPTRTHRVAAGGWLDSFIGDAIDALARRPSITYLEYMRTRLERSPSDLDGLIREPPNLFEHDGGVIVLSQVQSVTARVHMTAQRSGHGLTDCHVVLRSGELIINARYSNGLTHAVKAHHAGPPVMSVFLLDDKDRERARSGEVVPVPVAPATEVQR